MYHQLLVFVSAFAVESEGAIHAYLLDSETGQLTLVNRTTDVEQPFFMAVSPDKQYLFTNHSPGTFGGTDHEEFAAYKIEGDQGQLRLLNRQSSRGTASCYCEVDAAGKTLVAANYASGSIAVFPIKKNGLLQEYSICIPHQGKSIDPVRQTSSHPHCTLISPDNRFVLVADLGTDQVFSYQLKATDSQLSPAYQPCIDLPSGAGPRHLIFHPSGQYVYVINELNNTVTMYDYDSKLGSLVEQQTIGTLPEDFLGESFCADLKITPDGRWMYGTNRGHDSIVTYAVGDDGRLTLQKLDASLGEEPQNLAISPAGDWLLCANMQGNCIAVFKIDPQTGGLTSIGKSVVMPHPSCIIIII